MEQKNKKKISTQTIIKLLLAVVLLGLSAFSGWTVSVFTEG